MTRAAKTLDLEAHLDREPANSSAASASASGHRPHDGARARSLPHGRPTLQPRAPKLRVKMRATVSRLQQHLGGDHGLREPRPVQGHDARPPHRRRARRRPPAGRRAEELYEGPRDLFVAGFIGSPAMNSSPAAWNSGTIKTPIDSIPLDDELRWHPGASRNRHEGIIVGIRPRRTRGRGDWPQGPSGLGVRGADQTRRRVNRFRDLRALRLQKQQNDLEAEEELGEGQEAPDLRRAGQPSGHAVARVDANSTVKAGQRSKLWLKDRSCTSDPPTAPR